MTEVYIIGAARTAIGSIMGSLKSVPAHKLGTAVIKEVMCRAQIKPEMVDEVIMGNVLMAGQGQGPARQAAINAGIPNSTPAWTVNQICGSGLKSLSIGADMIKAGSAHCIITGGMESMSLAPHVANMRNGIKLGNLNFEDTVVLDALTDAFSKEHMGLTAERIAEQYNITREEADKFSALSHQKATKAWNENKFVEEITAIEIPQRKGEPVIFKKDEHYREDTSAEILAKLKPAFKKDGIITAGNASGVNDGAAAMVIASADFIKTYNIKPIAKIVSYATTGLDPAVMGLGPITASKKALEKAGWQIKDLERIEANEAFSTQSLAVIKDLGLNPEIVNVNGGAIALGHPVGCSGARILVTLLYELKHSGLHKGLATLCVGGGMGVAACVELC